MSGRKLGVGCIAVLIAFLTTQNSILCKDGGSVNSVKLPRGCPYAHLRITLDGYEVPTVRADSMEACMFGQGYMHAYHRLVQMDVLRRIGRGELAGFAGKDQLENDKLMRKLRLAEVAEESLKLLTPDERAALDAYTAGVNFYRSHCAELPGEYFMGGPPPVWTAQDSIIVARVISWTLNDDFFACVDWEKRRPRIAPGLLPFVDVSPVSGIVSHLASAGIGSYRQADLSASQWSSEGVTPYASPHTGDNPDFAGGEAAIGETHPGSNCFVVSGALTDTGLPILANDPHFYLTFPPIWYELRMDSPDFAAEGMTIPGIPSVIVGRNRDIAWGITAVGGDVSDAIRYKVRRPDPARPSSGHEYLTKDGWKPLSEHTETFETLDFKGRRTDTETVFETDAGPVIYDEGKSVIALKWVGMIPDREVMAFWEMSSAHDIAGFSAALTQISTGQNVLYCDNADHIAYFVTGKYPIRAYDGSCVADGETIDATWTDFLDASSLPEIVDPPQGYIVSANQPVFPIGSGETIINGSGTEFREYEDMIGGWRAYGHRAKRITQLLDEAIERGKVTSTDIARIQCDTYSITGEGFRDFAVKTLTDAGYSPGETGEPARAAYDALVNWDGRFDAHSAGAAVESLMMQFISDRLLRSRGYFSTSEREWDGRPDSRDSGPTLLLSERLLLARGRFGYFSTAKRLWEGGLGFGANFGALWDDPATPDVVEDGPTIIAWALEKSAAHLSSLLGPPEKWRWDSIHKMDLSYPVPFLGAFAPGYVPSPGGNDTVWLGSVRYCRDGWFVQEFGASMRVIMSPSSLGGGFLSILPGGQSGSATGEHSTDQLGLYLKGEYK